MEKETKTFYPKKIQTNGQTKSLLDEENLVIVQELGERIQNARNYMYSRLAGINSYLRLQKL